MEPCPKLSDRGGDLEFLPQRDDGRTEGGCWNGFIGRLLLLAGFIWAAGLDPWSLSQRDPAVLVGSPRMAARQAQAVMLGMAFLQLIVAGAIAGDARAWQRRMAAWLTGLGTLLYTAGYALMPSWSSSVWLIPAGALLNLGGFALLLEQLGRGDSPRIWLVVLPVICLGMLLDVVMGLFAANPEHFLPVYLGAEDGVRLRMLRLARAAAIALPAVALLYEGLAACVGLRLPLARWGRAALWCGVAGMSAVLAVAAFTSVHVKFFLPLPALTTFAGTCAGAVLANRHARALEFWGWLLIAASMGIGLFMGLYAFDGPLPAPDFLHGYNDFARRLLRLGHAYCIVLGLLSIFIAREPDTSRFAFRTRWMGIPLFVAGSIITIIAIFFVALSVLPTSALAVGPALVAVALIPCLAPYTPAR
ncbi:MAG TPA: hypothetical protein VN688_04690 [Gemmataceae bacterium]|nr:hypothetical protein [Gemmataceae bacterium]